MIITKKESKQLRYFARANYKADVQGSTAEDGGKVKHRNFPVFGLSYDEKKADKGMVEITNVTIEGKPFEGDYDDFMARLRKILDNPDALCDEELEQDKTLMEQHCEPCLLHGPDCTQEPLPPGPPIVQRLKESETGKNLENMAEAVSELAHPEMKVVKSEIKDLSEDGTLTIDVQAVADNPVDSVDVHIDVNKQKSEHESVSDPLGEITGTVNPTWSSGNENVEPLNDVHAKLAVEQIHKDFEKVVESDELPADNVDASESAKFVEEQNAPVLEVNAQNVETPVIENVEEAKQVVEETGTPVITAEQKPAVHLDAAAEGTKDASMVLDVSQPKKLTRGELNDLRIKCAVMKLAKSYGEPADMSIGEILLRYPNASMKLNDLYVADKIKPYTISEDAIREAYPDEYEVARKESVNV